MTWIDVVSDAVKIGLGAIIGALGALVSAHLAHRHRRSEEFSRRRRDLLEAVMPEFESVSMDVMYLSSDAYRAVSRGNSDSLIINEVEYNTASKRDEIDENNRLLNIVQSKILLVGFENLATQIGLFRNKAMNVCDLQQKRHKEFIEDYLELVELKDRAVREFASAYRNA